MDLRSAELFAKEQFLSKLIDIEVSRSNKIMREIDLIIQSAVTKLSEEENSKMDMLMLRSKIHGYITDVLSTHMNLVHKQWWNLRRWRSEYLQKHFDFIFGDSNVNHWRVRIDKINQTAQASHDVYVLEKCSYASQLIDDYEQSLKAAVILLEQNKN